MEKIHMQKGEKYRDDFGTTGYTIKYLSQEEKFTGSNENGRE